MRHRCLIPLACAIGLFALGGCAPSRTRVVAVQSLADTYAWADAMDHAAAKGGLSVEDQAAFARAIRAYAKAGLSALGYVYDAQAQPLIPLTVSP